MLTSWGVGGRTVTQALMALTLNAFLLVYFQLILSTQFTCHFCYVKNFSGLSFWKRYLPPLIPVALYLCVCYLPLSDIHYSCLCLTHLAIPTAPGVMPHTLFVLAKWQSSFSQMIGWWRNSSVILSCNLELRWASENAEEGNHVTRCQGKLAVTQTLAGVQGGEGLSASASPLVSEKVC